MTICCFGGLTFQCFYDIICLNNIHERSVALLNFLLSVVDESKHDKVLYLYNKYHSDLIRYAKSELRNANHRNFKNDAFDVVQNTYLKLLKYLPDEIKYEKSYVFTILDNEINKFLNEKEYYMDIYEHEDLVSEDEFIDALIKKEQIENIGALINMLNDKFRIPMLMKYGYEISVEQIAKQLDLTVPAVYKRLEKARAIIKKQLDEGDES